MGSNAMQIDFEDAVEEIKKFIQRTYFGQSIYAKDQRPWTAAGGAVQLENSPDQLIENSKTDHRAHDRLRLGIAWHLDQELHSGTGTNLPRAVCIWLSRYLRGDAPRPKAGKDGAPTKGNLHHIIYEAVKRVEELGFTPDRGDGTNVLPESACDVVAKALGELELLPGTPDHVATIYYQRKKKYS